MPSSSFERRAPPGSTACDELGPASVTTELKNYPLKFMNERILMMSARLNGLETKPGVQPFALSRSNMAAWTIE